MEVVRDERGASMILALAFIVVFGVIIGALLELGSTNMLATAQLSDTRVDKYAADGGLEASIRYHAQNPTVCSALNITIGAETANVTCAAETAAIRTLRLASSVGGVKWVEATVQFPAAGPVVTSWVSNE